MSLKLRCILLILILFIHHKIAAQEKRFREYKRNFQLSLFPGISTNGVGSGFYYNKFSFNLFGGLSSRSEIFEAGLITNINLRGSTGIQIAGLANIIGANAFYNLTLPEERRLINDDFECNMQGIQFAGFLNYVLDHFSGIQVSGGFNAVGRDMKGLQLAGIGNSAGGFAQGFMLAGFYNVVHRSVTGFQISTIFNFTDEELSGFQLGLINKARRIKGKKSTPPSVNRGLQIGLLNFSKSMDGVQIGLINLGGNARGKQIGLINFFSKYPSKEYTRMGTPIGLLNFGSKGSLFRFYGNELFAANFEYTTGNCLNCSWIMGSEMPYHDSKKIYNQNALILGYDPFRDAWGFGYGFQKILYNKVSVMPNPKNENKMISYGIRFLHLNKNMSLDRNFNLVNKLNVEYGVRLRSTVYLLAGVSLNYFLYEKSAETSYEISSFKISSGEVFGLLTKLWPGYLVGVQF